MSAPLQTDESVLTERVNTVPLQTHCRADALV